MTTDTLAKLTRALYLLKDAALSTDGPLSTQLDAVIEHLDEACLLASRQLDSTPVD